MITHKRMKNIKKKLIQNIIYYSKRPNEIIIFKLIFILILNKSNFQ